MKTEGAVAERARGQAKICLLLVLGFMAVVSLPRDPGEIFERVQRSADKGATLVRVGTAIFGDRRRSQSP